MCVEEEAQMAAPMKYTLQQDNKNQSDDKQTSRMKLFFILNIWRN